MNLLQTSKDDPNRITRCTFEGKGTLKVLQKSNFFVDLEENLALTDEKSKNLQLSKMELMIIQTAFFMAHDLNLSANKKHYDAETDFVISLKSFAELWDLDHFENLEDGSFYTIVRRAIQKLDKRRFLYKGIDSDQNRQVTVLSGYFSSIKFITSKNKVSEFAFSFPKDFIPYLKSYGQFTWYFFENTIKLRDHPNAILLYEQFSKNKNNPFNRKGKNEVFVSLDISKLRSLLSVGDGYNTNDMLRKIVKPAIDKINQESSIRVEEVEKIRDGKNIVSIKYIVEFKDADLNFKGAMIEVNEGKRLLTDAQILKYSLPMVQDANFCSVYMTNDEDIYEFIARISEELKSNDKVILYYPYLKKQGFKSQKVETKINNRIALSEK